MTTYVEAVEAVYKTWADAWGSRTPYALGNEKLDYDGLPGWARVVVRHNNAEQETLGSPGNRKFQRDAAVIVQLFRPTNTGMKLLMQDTVLTTNAFEGVRIVGTTVRFLNVTVREQGTDRGSKWEQVNVEAEFQYTETK